MSRCFLLEPTQQDVSSAEEYGRVVTLFYDHADHSPAFVPEFGDEIAQKLRDYRYDPEADFIILAGMHVALCAMCAAVACEYGMFQALCWDPRPHRTRYQPVDLGRPLVTR